MQSSSPNNVIKVLYVKSFPEKRTLEERSADDRTLIHR